MKNTLSDSATFCRQPIHERISMADLSGIIINISIIALPVLLAVTFHEVAHGWVAYKFGDDTAKNAGRLTLNPIKHLDPVGTLVFIVTRMIGWAKPVPVNPSLMKNPRQDMLWVSAAGPAANLALAAVFGFLFQVLDTGWIVAPPYIFEPLIRIVIAGVTINCGLAVFNLIPIPPLDGAGILTGILPPHAAMSFERIRPYGFIILLILIFTRLVDKIIFPIVLFLAHFFLGLQ
jgi:Zn-dependent protease